MAAGGATAAGGGLLEADRHPPTAKGFAFFTDQTLPVSAVRLMTKTATASFSGIGDMHEMEIAIAVTKAGVERRFRKAQKILLVTLQTEIVGSLLIGEIQLFGIGTGQQAGKRRTMGIVTRAALPLPNRLVQIFFAIEFFLDVFQGRAAEIVDPVATETEIFFLRR